MKQLTCWGFAVASLLPLIAGCSSSKTNANTAAGNDSGLPGSGGATGADGAPAGGTAADDPSLAGGPVALGGVVNARQTGGLVTADGRRVRANVLIRSGQLSDLTAAGCDDFAALGVHTVIDLRAATAVAAAPDPDCVTEAGGYYNADLPKILPPTAQSYLQTLDATEPVLAEVYSRLSGADALPAIIHCVIGRDRASLTMALVLLSLGVPESDVLVDFEQNQEVDTDPAWMQGVLDRTEQAGGIEPYLAEQGVTAQLLDALRDAALQ